MPRTLWDMLDAIRRTQFIVNELPDDAILSDDLRLLALERGMEILGEAARRVSVGFQESHPEVPWRQIIGQRNLIAHEYGSIDHRRLLQTARREMPELAALLHTLLPPVDDPA